ncbi:hypothetical protein LKO27_02805 [Tessaracoccus sp. OS52]|uniref:hypothetical protein n=1 Tax=Tessaracoccus sp. OS52 TaxID=2886691 RepID=UPI001D129331|nr:hypothetical protein [Tessaracoccus sp. OS52]MCC2592354.1 hypothetical protein [Tessaracoccus sp. OS52]
MSGDSRLLGNAQRALPLVLLTLGVIELGAVLGSVVVGAEPPDPAAVAGPGAFVPVTLAVVFATLLRANRSALPVKAVTAVGAASFALVRIGLVAITAAGGAATGIEEVLGAVSGVVLGLTIAAWAAVESHTARVRVRAVHSQHQVVPVPPPTQPVTATGAGAQPASPAPHPSPATARPAAPRPLQVRSVQPLSQVTPPSRGAPFRGVAAVAWQRGSTPWPRKDEDDPDGTLLRPPRRR